MYLLNKSNISSMTNNYNGRQIVNVSHQQDYGKKTVSQRNNATNDDGDSSSYLTMYGDHKAEQSITTLPGWLQNYIQWNRNIQQSNNREKKQYIVLLCIQNDDSCGGLSDRFRGLLWYLFLAKASNRLLCIHWTRPFPLQTFLEPTSAGFDWTCPEDELTRLIEPGRASGSQSKLKTYYFMDCEETSKHPAQETAQCVSRELDHLLSSNRTFPITRLFGNSVPSMNALNIMAQRYSYQDTMPLINQWQHPDMIEDIFRTLFKPVKPLARRINATMTRLGLKENEYVSVHVRARYPVRKHTVLKLAQNRSQVDAIDKGGKLAFEGEMKKYLIGIIENAIECGHQLDTNLPLYFASDHNNVTNYALEHEFTGQNSTKRVQPLGVQSDQMPVHVGIRQFKGLTSTDLYSVFEDLLIMGGSKCVSHGMGSFGSFGAGLAGNNCRAVHRRYNGLPEKCPNDRGVPKAMSILDSDKLSLEESSAWGKKLIFHADSL